jgi:DNA-binding CsgD family transcriptional regulator
MIHDANFLADRAAIIATLEAECAAYLAKDFPLYASFWVHEPYVRRWNWHADVGMVLNRGWEEDSRMIREGMQHYPEPIIDDVRREWGDFVISGDLAWVTFEQYSAAQGDPFQITGHQHEMKVLQKRNGRWLIACSSSLKPRSEVARCPLVRVDGKGRVLWLNQSARLRLVDHPGLMLSAGRLRTRHRAADRALQTAIVLAAGSLGHQHMQAALHDKAATGGALPVLADLGGEVATILCWVTPADGMVLVNFDDAMMLDQRILAAGVIFGLSPAQQRLARLLIDGHDLAAAASAQGVSVNTARTQLQRMFDKTGVHNQAALVRVLLSIAPPLA